MIESPREPRVSLPQPLAVRVAILGGLALALFAIVLFRLWYLQILSGPQYVQAANSNRVRDIPIAAPRGEILDRTGQPIVTNQTVTAIQLVRSKLPAATDVAGRQALYRRLAGILGMHAGFIAKLVEKPTYSYENVTIQTDASPGALAYLAERADEFPAVSIEPIQVRQYPFGEAAAQMLGNVGLITPAELGYSRFKGVHKGATVGQAGLELVYDHYLRGRDGAKHVQVEASGNPTRQLGVTLPLAGHDIRLGVDLRLQQEGEKALRQGMGLAQANGNSGDAGAFVAMDPNSGTVLAMGSYPSYDPSVLTKPIDQATYDRIFGPHGKNPGPQFNRAIEGGYATGSTFKPITALAGLQSGIITPSTVWGGGQCVVVGAAHQRFCNAGGADLGDLDLLNALRVSEDTYFYRVGEAANGRQGEVIQTVARQFGLGRPTGIDLPGELGGIVPDRAWRAARNAQEVACERQRHVHSCLIADGRDWSVGDNINFSVGQGDLEATPLQMATAYSTLVNGGTVWRPHLATEIDDSQGGLVQAIQPHVVRHVAIDPGYRQVIMNGLHAATSQSGGTSADVFAGWPQNALPVYGKTGTAQRTGQQDQSWYVCYVPNGPKHSIVIAVTIEHGGFGAQAAAPAARLMLSEWFGQKLKLVAGKSQTR